MYCIIKMLVMCIKFFDSTTVTQSHIFNNFFTDNLVSSSICVDSNMFSKILKLF